MNHTSLDNQQPVHLDLVDLIDDCRSETDLPRIIPLRGPGKGAALRVAEIMRGNGATYREIADHLHVSLQYVERVLRR